MLKFRKLLYYSILVYYFKFRFLENLGCILEEILDRENFGIWVNDSNKIIISNNEIIILFNIY